MFDSLVYQYRRETGYYVNYSFHIWEKYPIPVSQFDTMNLPYSKSIYVFNSGE